MDRKQRSVLWRADFDANGDIRTIQVPAKIEWHAVYRGYYVLRGTPRGRSWLVNTHPTSGKRDNVYSGIALVVQSMETFEKVRLGSKGRAMGWVQQRGRQPAYHDLQGYIEKHLNQEEEDV